MKKTFLIFCCCSFTVAGFSQLNIQAGATLYIESGAKVTVQGDVTSAADIQGPGSVVMKGTALQSLNMNGKTIPNLEIDNVANVTLSGSSTRVGTNLLFTNGKVLTSAQDLLIGSSATVSGNSATRFIWTDGAGQAKKELTADVANFELPVGESTNYRPVYLTSTGGSYSSANIGVRVVSGSTPNKPPQIVSYISAYWPVTKAGITGGTQTISAQYVDPSDVVGTEGNLAGYFFNGTDWTSASETHDAAANRIAAPISTGSGQLTALNKFIAVGARAFLQGAYNSGTGLMTDNLRAGTNLIPVTDPYRSAPYTTAFSHLNNNNVEMVSATVFNNQASVNDDIVDWVFLELRNTASPGNTVLQTRSALIQRDGDIVDVDGISPVTFNNVSDGNYTLAVRHRNHLGLATSPGTPQNFAEKKSLAFSTNVSDLRVASTTLFGTAGTNYTSASHPTLSTVNLLWSGNANANGNVRFNGPSNDRDYLLSTVLGGNQATVLGIYTAGDVNMNKSTRYNGPANDRDFMLSSSLGGSQATIRTQALPN